MKPYVLIAASFAALAPIQAYAGPPKTINFPMIVSTGPTGASACLPNAHGVVIDHTKSTTGNGEFSRVTFIQRLFTDGGKPPAAGCQPGQTEVLVEYSAQYSFYVPAAR